MTPYGSMPSSSITTRKCWEPDESFLRPVSCILQPCSRAAVKPAVKTPFTGLYNCIRAIPFRSAPAPSVTIGTACESVALKATTTLLLSAILYITTAEQSPARHREIILTKHVPTSFIVWRYTDLKKGLTELVFILDRSGSMQGLEADTIGGFNAMIEKQKKEEGEAYVSAVLFDDRQEVIYDRVALQKVEPMTDRQYYVRGCTALLDAVGGAVHHIGNVHKYARNEDVPEKTIFVITTDGMENASRSYSLEKVRRMIERQQKKYHWEFLFLGANIDAVAEASRFGIHASRAANYVHDSIGTRRNFDVLSKAISGARAATSAEEMNAMFDCAEPMAAIREDYEKRGKRGRR